MTSHTHPFHRSIWLAGITALALGGSACGTTDPTLVVLGNALPTDLVTCAFTIGGQNVNFRLTGQLDTETIAASPFGGYFMALAVQNNHALNAPADTINPVHDVRLTRADLTFRTASDEVRPTAPIANRRVEISGFVRAGQVSPTVFNAIDLARIQALDANLVDRNDRLRIVINVKVHGEALDGTKLKSETFTWPVEVCRGCLNSTRCPAEELQFNCLEGQDFVEPLCGAQGS